MTTYYVWDESYTDEGIGGTEVEADSAEMAIAKFHAETMGNVPIDEEEYHATTEKPEWWDKEEAS
jgi:hypothetical protein